MKIYEELFELNKGTNNEILNCKIHSLTVLYKTWRIVINDKWCWFTWRKHVNLFGKNGEKSFAKIIHVFWNTPCVHARLKRATNASCDFIGVIDRNACGSPRRVIPLRPSHSSAVVVIMKRRLITAAETVYDYVENRPHGMRLLWSRWNVLRVLLMHRMNLRHSWH